MTTDRTGALAKICAALEAGKTLEAAAKAAGVHTSTLTSWCRADEALCARVNGARSRGLALRPPPPPPPPRPKKTAPPAAPAPRREERDTRVSVGASDVEEALLEAATAAVRLVGRDPRLAHLPPNYGSDFRRAYHSLKDTERRGTLLQLLVEEGGRLLDDASASFGQRPRHSRPAESQRSGPDGHTHASRGEEARREDFGQRAPRAEEGE